jgi:hypothetical protein
MAITVLTPAAQKPLAHAVVSLASSASLVCRDHQLTKQDPMALDEKLRIGSRGNGT